MVDGQYSKHSFKFSELKRIYHICEKKERLKAEQREREREKEQIIANRPRVDKNGFVIDPDFGKKNRHRGKKGKKKITNASD